MATPDGVKKFSAQSVKPKNIGGSEAARFSADSGDRDVEPDFHEFSAQAGDVGPDYKCINGAGFTVDAGTTQKAHMSDVDVTAGKGRPAAKDGDASELD